MRYLAIDLGGKRTGLAVGDDVSAMVSPVGTIETSSPQVRLQQIGQAIAEHEPGELVLGLPLNMDNSEGPPAKAVRALGDELTKRFGLPVHLVDERLTSFAADQQMQHTGLTRGQKKSRRDALAAAAILRDFLAQRLR
jgi:putative Holliday junction resolvase